METPSQTIRVLVVDDSLLMRKLITRILSTDAAIIVAHQASNGREAMEWLGQNACDVITLDLEMPEMGGLEFLKQYALTDHAGKVLVLSHISTKDSPVTFQAFDLGAADVVHKPSGSISLDIGSIGSELVHKVRELAAEKHMRRMVRSGAISQGTPTPHSVTLLPDPPAPGKKSLGFERATERHRYEILCIGSSTGGPQALRSLLPRFHSDFPYPVVIIQHMSEGFTQGFAETLNLVCELKVAEAKEGEALVAGRVYVATANHHLGLERRGGALHARLTDGEKVSGHRPSVDFFLESAAHVCRDKAIAIILTGMGSDGAKGMVQVRKAGGATIGQSQKTCVVYGMPRVADALGGVEFVEDLDRIYNRVSSVIGSVA